MSIHPKTEDEFLTALRSLIGSYGGGSGFAAEVGMIVGGSTEARESAYESGANVMRDVAVLAFNYAAHVVGASGFQASVAAMQAYGEIVGIKNFGVMRMDDLLYPQYDLHAKLDGWIAEAMPRIRDEARQRLAELRPDSVVSPRVVAHWRQLAEMTA